MRSLVFCLLLTIEWNTIMLVRSQHTAAVFQAPGLMFVLVWEKVSQLTLSPHWAPGHVCWCVCFVCLWDKGEKTRPSCLPQELQQWLVLWAGQFFLLIYLLCSPHCSARQTQLTLTTAFILIWSLSSFSATPWFLLKPLSDMHFMFWHSDNLENVCDSLTHYRTCTVLWFKCLNI